VNDDRISRHLHAQAETIVLPPADPTGTMRRGSRRRTRRRAGLAGAVAVAGILATTVAVRSTDDPQQQLTLGSPSAAASTYDWSVVTPKVGLGYGSLAQGAQTADGTVYSISTSPGAQGSSATPAPALYRSSDGAEWVQRSLPSGLRTYGLAAAGDTLYGIGTAPSGGIVLAASQDGAGSWSTAAQLPDDLLQLRQRHPDQIQLSVPQVAALDASHLVVTMVAATNLDLTKLGHPEYGLEGYRWTWDAQGVSVFEQPKSQCDVASGAPEAVDAAAAGCRAVAAGAKQVSEEPVASFTYDELGVSDEVRDHVGGTPYVYVSDDAGTTFRRTDLPAGALPESAEGVLDLRPLATPDGFRLFASGYDGQTSRGVVLRSGDGATWTPSGSFPGGVSDIGVVGGHAAASVWDAQGTTIEIEGPDGWTTVDVSRLIDAPEGTEAYLSTAAFGPLGLAAVVGIADEEGPAHEYVVHSADGAAFQVVDVSEHVRTGGMVAGLVVTPDAIAARIITPTDDDPRTPPTQQVLVGTPH
jgi:hypothetical protein